MMLGAKYVLLVSQKWPNATYVVKHDWITIEQAEREGGTLVAKQGAGSGSKYDE